MPTPRPHDAHVGIREIADLYGLERGTVAQWNLRGKLPPSCCTVSGQPAWPLAIIRQWARQADLQPVKGDG